MDRSDHAPEKLRRALASLLLGVAVPLLAGAFWFLWHEWDMQRDAAINRLRDVALSLQLSVDRELFLHHTALQVLATSPEINRGDWSAFYSVAKETSNVRPGSWVVLGDRSGKTILNTLVPFGARLPDFMPAPMPEMIEWEGRDVPWFDAGVLADPLRTGKIRVSNLFYGPVVKAPALGISIPVMRDGRPLYALAFLYRPDSLLGLLNIDSRNDQLLLGIIDANGLYIARNLDSKGSMARPAPAPFDKPKDLPHDGVLRTATLEGVPAFFAFHHSDIADWTVVVAMSRNATLAPVLWSLVHWVLLAVTLIMLTGLLTYRFWRRVAVPLTALAEQAQTGNVTLAPADIEEVEALRKALLVAADAERKRVEETRLRLQAEHEARVQAERGTRMREEMMAVVAHDLRSPLQTITMGAAALPSMNDEQRARYVQIMQRTAKGMSRLLDDLLDAARMDAGHFSVTLGEVPVQALCDEAMELFEVPAREQNIALTCEVSDYLPAIRGDRARLVQVLSNVIGNALKFTPPYGEVKVSAVRADSRIVISVRDTGPGMAPTDLPHLFDRFWRAKRATRQGAGLGLYIAKGIVDAHGGEVSVESDIGHGTTIHIALPAIPVEQRDVDSRSTAQQAP